MRAGEGGVVVLFFKQTCVIIALVKEGLPFPVFPQQLISLWISLLCYSRVQTVSVHSLCRTFTFTFTPTLQIVSFKLNFPATLLVEDDFQAESETFFVKLLELNIH